MPTWLIRLPGDAAKLENRLRVEGDPPVIARIENGHVVLDLRTVNPGREERVLLERLGASGGVVEYDEDLFPEHA